MSDVMYSCVRLFFCFLLLLTAVFSGGVAGGLQVEIEGMDEIDRSVQKGYAEVRRVDAEREARRRESSGNGSGGINGGLGNVCASINDMSLKTYCNTGDCKSLGFNYPEHQALCTYNNSNSLYKTKLHTAIQNYINYGQCDSFQLREKAGLSQTTVNSFCRVKDSASLRTMMVIMWLNGITFRY